ncbi:biotin--[acetyl-CoA-carboxylase] ligase [Dehalogenimonas etheniformans]|uniref:biotin--[biotin carboxyl-carrier protein] ligase n=1 Tax=Dehalogenimonas etheniformans TaxID=1536648 RepID=A0A2P5P677_9CHLR|nr:biotin--[acetyl-CoA-carboxylase] ligase [Dehalogenimonas etheniformans]PPD57779.1 biotin--[acetyl-CoA-carboxylase] ligase [Dehalogenimonas etheniformans]QNT76120.1 biotin--[acetyl-CoA-carboxylase] ligase [Dehalogenimonas etheniformans]
MHSLDFGSVEKALAGCRWGHTLFTYDSIGSTMDRAGELAHKGAREGALVIAAEQTEGRGRLNRKWISPPGSLYFSVLLYPPIEKLPYLTMLAGLAVAEAIEECVAVQAGLKWPNDVLIGGRKAAGMLVESSFSRGKQYAVIGVGINVNVDISTSPEITGVATSLSEQAGMPVDSLNLLRAAIDRIESRYSNFDKTALLDSWKARLITLGQPVKATMGEATIEGTATDVTDEGALIIRRTDGSICTVVAGDVTLS